MDKEEKNRKERTNQTTSLQLIRLTVLNAVHSAYIINYNPKMGKYHVWLCSFIGLMIIVFCIWSAINSFRMLIKKESPKGYIIIVLILTFLLFVMGADSTLPYYKDILGGSQTVTMSSYLVIRENLSFLDDKGNGVTIKIPEDKAYELREKEAYEYDQENNLLKHQDYVTITYYPNSKVLLEIK